MDPKQPDRTLERQRVFSGAPWEAKVGYCRALRVGPFIYVTGTAPVADDGSVYAPGNATEQARRCFTIIRKALKDIGADVSDVVRTRMFVTDANRWQEFGVAHQETFGQHPVATTMVEVKRLIDPAMMIEVEADAIAVSRRAGERFF